MIKSVIPQDQLFSEGVMKAIAQEKTDITQEDFINHCTACGGNWTAMIITGIKEIFPLTYAALPDVNYAFEDVCNVIYTLGVHE